MESDATRSAFASAKVARLLKKCGWREVRQRGSHIILTKSGHIATLSVPKHDFVARGTLRSLIAKAEMTADEFLLLLNN